MGSGSPFSPDNIKLETVPDSKAVTPDLFQGNSEQDPGFCL